MDPYERTPHVLFLEDIILHTLSENVKKFREKMSIKPLHYVSFHYAHAQICYNTHRLSWTNVGEFFLTFRHSALA
jgi:hypothetical protein